MRTGPDKRLVDGVVRAHAVGAEDNEGDGEQEAEHHAHGLHNLRISFCKSGYMRYDSRSTRGIWST